jgi:hypothetical protein
MVNNESLKKMNYYYQETRDLFRNERSKAKKHMYYAQLRLQFLEWLERGWMDELVFKVDTEKHDNKNLEEVMAWQEAVIMFGDELRDDEFYVDIVGNTHNYSVTWSYGKPSTDEEKASLRKLIKETMADKKLGYKEKKKLDGFFHSLMNMKPKEEVLFHNRYKEFEAMVKENSVKGDTYQTVIAKISKPSKKLKGKSPLETFLAKK